MTQPYFSILIPVYNSSAQLSACLDSIFTQKNAPEFEVIAVDDASSDKSPDILKQYQEKHKNLTVLLKDKNQGTYQARKDAVLIARGKYLIFADSDDALLPDFFEKAYNATQTGDYDIIQFQTEKAHGVPGRSSFQSTKYPNRTILEGRDILTAFFELKLPDTLWAKVFNAEFVKAHELDNPPNCYGEDHLRSTILAIHAKKYLYLHDKVYRYNFGAGVGGRACYTLPQFERFCKNSMIYEIVKQEIIREKLPQFYLQYVEWMKFEVLKIQIMPILKNKIPQESMDEALDIMFRYWGKEMLQLYFNSDFINTQTPLIKFLLAACNYCRNFINRWFLRISGKSICVNTTER